jgi:integrase
VAAALSAGNRQADSKWHDGDLLFAQPNGRPIDKKTDHDDWTRLLKAAGVRHVRLLSENVHPRVVRELVGHSQMRTTMDIYSHVTPALARGGRPDERPAAAR